MDSAMKHTVTATRCAVGTQSEHRVFCDRQEIGHELSGTEYEWALVAARPLSNEVSCQEAGERRERKLAAQCDRQAEQQLLAGAGEAAALANHLRLAAIHRAAQCRLTADQLRATIASGRSHFCPKVVSYGRKLEGLRQRCPSGWSVVATVKFESI